MNMLVNIDGSFERVTSPDLPEICVTRLKAVAAALRASETDVNALPLVDGEALGFNMEVYCGGCYDLRCAVDRTNQNCETVGCIAGWVVAMFGRCADGLIIAGDAAEMAAKALHLSEDDLMPLFLPKDINDNYNATPSQAADAIDRFLAGKKPWPEEEE